MVVYMGTICMGCDNERLFSFCKAFRQFIASSICFFRSNLPRFERLTYLIGNHISFWCFQVMC